MNTLLRVKSAKRLNNEPDKSQRKPFFTMMRRGKGSKASKAKQQVANVNNLKHNKPLHLDFGAVDNSQLGHVKSFKNNMRNNNVTSGNYSSGATSSTSAEEADQYELFRNMFDQGYDQRTIEVTMRKAGLDPGVIFGEHNMTNTGRELRRKSQKDSVDMDDLEGGNNSVFLQLRRSFNTSFVGNDDGKRSIDEVGSVRSSMRSVYSGNVDEVRSQRLTRNRSKQRVFLQSPAGSRNTLHRVNSFNSSVSNNDTSRPTPSPVQHTDIFSEMKALEPRSTFTSIDINDTSFSSTVGRRPGGSFNKKKPLTLQEELKAKMATLDPKRFDKQKMQHASYRSTMLSSAASAVGSTPPVAPVYYNPRSGAKPEGSRNVRGDSQLSSATDSNGNESAEVVRRSNMMRSKMMTNNYSSNNLAHSSSKRNLRPNNSIRPKVHHQQVIAPPVSGISQRGTRSSKTPAALSPTAAAQFVEGYDEMVRASFRSNASASKRPLSNRPIMKTIAAPTEVYHCYKLQQIDNVPPSQIIDAMERDGYDPIVLFPAMTHVREGNEPMGYENPWEEKYSKRYLAPYYQNKRTGEVLWREEQDRGGDDRSLGSLGEVTVLDDERQERQRVSEPKQKEHVTELDFDDF